MDDYTVRVRGEEAEDDGKGATVDDHEWPGPAGHEAVCPDCGAKEVVWAEAGFVPGHRVCRGCGSHWSVASTGEAVGRVANSHGGFRPVRRWALRRARFY